MWVVVVGFVLVYFVILACLYIYRNPSNTGGNLESVVTFSRLGTMGDMGNHIFQLASTIAAARRSGAKVVLPKRVEILPLSSLFDLTMFQWEDVTPDATFREYDNYELITIPRDGRAYDISGYRQAYSYFDDFSSEIREIFTPREELLEEVRSLVPLKYISVHIRRGDYISPTDIIPLLRKFHRCQLPYYKEGIRKLREIHPNYPLIVCTDDREWVSHMLPELGENIALSPISSRVSAKLSDFCVLYLSEGVVMSNSTYSWMASYLRGGRPIVSPSPWWDSNGFVATAFGLDGPYLAHPFWWILSAEDGRIIRQPMEEQPSGKIVNDNHETLNLYRLIRGMI